MVELQAGGAVYPNEVNKKTKRVPYRLFLPIYQTACTWSVFDSDMVATFAPFFLFSIYPGNDLYYIPVYRECSIFTRNENGRAMGRHNFTKNS